MKLLNPELTDRLTANGKTSGDHAPVVKFFNPLGAGTWLFSEIDGDTLFGLCDLGFGCAELGSASLSEIGALRLPLRLTIERDLHFEGRFPLSVYAEAARARGAITENTALLRAAAVRPAAERPELPPSIPPDGG